MGRRERDPNAYRQMSLAMMIPGLLVAGPIVGYLLGRGLQKWLGWGDWVIPAMVLLGLAAGISETVEVIRKLNKS